MTNRVNWSLTMVDVVVLRTFAAMLAMLALIIQLSLSFRFRRGRGGIFGAPAVAFYAVVVMFTIAALAYAAVGNWLLMTIWAANALFHLIYRNNLRGQHRFQEESDPPVSND